MTLFRLPDLGEGLSEAEIVAWHVAAGDHVTADQPLVSVETEKAVVEVPSPRSGRIKALLAKPGETIKVGEPLIEFLDDKAPDKGAVVGELRDEKQATTTKPPPKAKTGERVKAAPAIRRLAEEKGVDLAAIEPTGRHGEITAEDIRAAGEKSPVGGGSLAGARRTMARHMAEAGARVVPATVTEDADIHAWPAATAITPRLVRAAVAACRAEPTLNAWYDEKAKMVTRHDGVELGIAVDSPDGLFVPVLKEADTLSLKGVEEAVADLEAGIRARNLPPEAFRGATLTLSNFGALGGRYAAMTVLPPQVAILGAGRARPGLVAAEGTPAIRTVLPLSLTFDHRVVTGGEAARFLMAAIADLERTD